MVRKRIFINRDVESVLCICDLLRINLPQGQPTTCTSVLEPSQNFVSKFEEKKNLMFFNLISFQLSYLNL